MATRRKATRNFSDRFGGAKRNFGVLWCFYCGLPADTVDHLIPLSRGGQDHAYNTAPCCAACNVLKDNMTVAEFKAKYPQGSQTIR